MQNQHNGQCVGLPLRKCQFDSDILLKYIAGQSRGSSSGSYSRKNYFKKLNFCINSARFRVVGEGNNLKPKAIRILESYIKSIFTLVQIQYAEQPEGRVVRIPPPLLKTIFKDVHYEGFYSWMCKQATRGLTNTQNPDCTGC